MLHRRVQHPEIPPCTQFQFQPMVTPASERARVRRPARSNARDLSDAAEWRQLDSPVKDLRAFGLEQELAFPQTRAGADVHHLSVDEGGDIAAVTDHLDASPLSGGAFDIALPPKTFHILPLRIASVPVEPALTRVASSTCGRMKSKSISVSQTGAPHGLTRGFPPNRLTGSRASNRIQPWKSCSR